MKSSTSRLWSIVCSVVMTAGLAAQTPASAPAQQGSTPQRTPPGQQQQQQPPASQQPADQQSRPTFVVNIDLVTNDVIVRDDKGNFVPDLKKDEFEVYEDGVKQDIVQMTVVTGGRVT